MIINQQCALVAQAVSSHLVCVRESIAKRLRELILLLHSALVKTLSAGCSPEIPSVRGMETGGESQFTDCEDNQGSCEEKWRAGTLQPRETAHN